MSITKINKYVLGVLTVLSTCERLTYPDILIDSFKRLYGRIKIKIEVYVIIRRNLQQGCVCCTMNLSLFFIALPTKCE